MNTKIMMMLVLASILVGTSFSAPQFLGRPGGFRRPGFGGPGFGGANAAGFGNGFVQNNQAVGTGTGIANAGPGGFGIGLGVGAGVATPIGNFAFGDGQSISAGK
ncbi:glycine-rich cell wall structural protein 1-like [Daphnia pulex]|uniref:glycine-rich cell wall structural protein 1-like n=1 Tax=Daphnia pulex TaxID=6669 RepID=UPI001EDDD304|nr:glycine-rich cell wall structural protein 1-like [Daphnia pulex]